MDIAQTVAAIITALGVREIAPTLIKGITGRREKQLTEVEFLRRKYDRSRKWRMSLETWSHRVRILWIGKGHDEAELPPLPEEPPDIDPPKTK